MRKYARNLAGFSLLATLALGASLALHRTRADSVVASQTHGTIPPQAFSERGLDLTRVPDLVAIADPDGGPSPVGYSRKVDLYPSAFGDSELAAREYRLVPVYDARGTTLIGHLYPDYGFVSLETSSSSGFDINALIQARRAQSGR